MAKEIRGISKLVEVTGASRFAFFSRVRSFNFFEEGSSVPKVYTIRLVMDSEREGTNYRLQMKFSHVLDVRGLYFSGRSAQIVGLDILDLSEDQLEGISFEVIDYESGNIHFYCADAEIESIVPIGDAGASLPANTH